MSSPNDNIDDNADRGANLVALIWVLSVTAMGMLTLRFFARRRIKAIGVDDWLMLCGLVR